MVNPITISINGKGKERLILDLRRVNKQVVLNKIKFENWITLKQYVTKGGFGFVLFYISQIGLPPHRYFSRISNFFRVFLDIQYYRKIFCFYSITIWAWFKQYLLSKTYMVKYNINTKHERDSETRFPYINPSPCLFVFLEHY